MLMKSAINLDVIHEEREVGVDKSHHFNNISLFAFSFLFFFLELLIQVEQAWAKDYEQIPQIQNSNT